MAAVPDLAGRPVLVTGASTGIGAAAARAFVGVHYHASREAAQEVAADVERARGRPRNRSERRTTDAPIDRATNIHGRENSAA